MGGSLALEKKYHKRFRLSLTKDKFPLREDSGLNQTIPQRLDTAGWFPWLDQICGLPYPCEFQFSSIFFVDGSNR